MFYLCASLNSPELVSVVLVEPRMGVAYLAVYFFVDLPKEAVVVQLSAKRLVDQSIKLSHKNLLNELGLLVDHEEGVVWAPIDDGLRAAIIDDPEELGNKWFNSVSVIIALVVVLGAGHTSLFIKL